MNKLTWTQERRKNIKGKQMSKHRLILSPQRPKQERGPSKRKVSPAHTKDKAMQVTRKKFNFRYFNDFQMIKRLDQIKNDLFQSKI